MKKLFTLALMAIALTATAQEKSNKWYDNIKFSGYSMLQYQASDKYSNKVVTHDDGTKETVAVKDADNTFNLRLARLILDGKISDFDWRAQIQATNAKGPAEPTVQLVDLYAEWVKYKEARIRIGQFKRAFTFENPMNPITQGWYSYANVINSLSGLGDRSGEKASGGRDIGVQLQVTSSPMPADAACSTTRWACTTAKASTPRTRTSARTSSEVSGLCPCRDSASVPLDGLVAVAV